MMFVNGVTFLKTIPRDIMVFTAKHIKYFTAPILISSLNKVALLYKQGCFIVQLILMKMEFEKVKNWLN